MRVRVEAIENAGSVITPGKARTIRQSEHGDRIENRWRIGLGTYCAAILALTPYSA